MTTHQVPPTSPLRCGDGPRSATVLPSSSQSSRSYRRTAATVAGLALVAGALYAGTPALAAKRTLNPGGVAAQSLTSTSTTYSGTRKGRTKTSPSPTATTSPTPTSSPTPTATTSPTPTASPTPTSSTTATTSPSPTASTAPTTSTTTSSPVADPNALPVGDLAGWTQVFAEDFTTDAPLGSWTNNHSWTANLSGPSAYAGRWMAYPNSYKDTSKNGTYDPAKTLSVSNGMLDIWVHTENGIHYVAAPMPKLPVMTYGRYSIRFQSDAVSAYKTAWLLWPDSESWPNDGEIDFPEGNLDSTICAFAHYASSGGGQDAYCTGQRFTSWHTATVEWKPGKVVFYLDGNVIGTSTTMVPSRPMHWVIQTETQIGSAPSDAAQGHVRIDWVAAWTYTP